MGIIGLGRIGQAMAQRAHGFEMEVHGFDLYWPDAFVKDYPVTRHESALSVLREADVITLHTNLSDETRDLINEDSIAEMKDDAWLINTARGELVNAKAVVAALNAGKLAGYVTDVLDEEPPAAGVERSRGPHRRARPLCHQLG